MSAFERMLEFYPDQQAMLASLLRRPFAVLPAGSRRAPMLIALALALASALGGCAQTGTVPPDAPGSAARPTAPPLPANVEPPQPAVNLSGFPLPYRQGYADGCASASGPERKDAVRYGADGNYRTGWTDGLALCRKK
jgi:hypothetical protein